MRRISVVLPVYNERESIVPCLSGLAAALADVDHEILVCHDTDEDTTLPAIAAMPDRPASVRLVKNTLGRGALQAIRAGFAAAQGDVVVTTMADLSDPPGQILPMAEKIRDGADVVSGSRYMPGGSQRGGPWLKRTLSRIAGVSLRWITGIGTHDATSNFRAYSSAFLKDVVIESRAGFEIALELTVKAHLAGRRVDEVPSSWVERSSGESNFRLWKWLPSYLRWYLRAARVPFLVWGVTAAAFLVAISRPPWSQAPAILHRPAAVLFLAGAVASLLAARQRRGRTKLVDLVQSALWLHPGHGALWTAGRGAIDLALTAVASLVLLGRPFPWKIPARRVTTRGLALGVAALLVWLVHVRIATDMPSRDLDPSWEAALAEAALRGLRAGVDYVFTYGPFGFLPSTTYSSEVLALQVGLWEIGVKLLLAVFLVRAGTLAGRKLDTILFLVLLFPSAPRDTFLYLSLFGLTAWMLRGERVASGTILLGLAILALLAQVKFVFLPVAVLAVLAVAASRAARAGATAAAASVLGFLAAFAGLWWIAGQRLGDVPAWLEGSLLASTGYAGGCSTVAPPGSRPLALLLFALFAVQAAVLFARPPATGVARPSARGQRALAAIALPYLWIVFKGGFIRASDHTPTFFAFTLVASFLLAAPRSTPFRDGLGFACRAACVLASVAGLVIGEPAKRSPSEWLAPAGRQIARATRDLLCPGTLRGSCEARLAEIRREVDLPRTRSAIGDRSIDAVAWQQGIVLLNRFAWRPRPIFQGHMAYSLPLMELNAEFLESGRASEFLLLHHDAIDAHYPAQEDALALQIVARDYVPVLAEEGQLLLRREPRADADARHQGADARYQGADARHPIELEAGIGFGETLELAPGREGCRLLRIDVAETTLGKLLRFLENAPPLRAEFVLDSGETFRATLSPAMIRAGFLFDPCLRSASDWVTWFTGGALPRPIRLRIEAPDSPSRYGERLRVQVLCADDLVPRARPDLADEALFSLFREQPSAHRAAGPPAMRTLRGRDVLLLRAPSELRFDVAAGEHALTARFGILASEWQAGCPGGARFRAVLEVPGGDALVVFEKDVDPVRVEIDRRLKFLDVRFVAPVAGTLSLRTEPGTGGGTPCTETVWTDVAID